MTPAPASVSTPTAAQPGALRVVRVLTDGRPGHENQSQGLALALARRTGARIETVKLDPTAPVWTRARLAAAPGPEPIGLLVATGHRTHLPLWWAARRLRARSVVIMSPSLPLACFDLALVPRHDLPPGATDTPRRLLTRGALNRVPEDLPPKENRGLILLGGPSRHHGFDGPALSSYLSRIVASEPGLHWLIADSRRTPADFLASFTLPTGADAENVHHATTAPGWLAGELARARLVWATADSVSMAHEAVTARAAVGILPAPPLRAGGGRPQRAIDDLIASGAAIAYHDWVAGRHPLRPGPPLHEAARAAEAILQRRWFA